MSPAFALLRESVVTPSAAARRLLALGVSLARSIELVVLVATLGGLLYGLLALSGLLDPAVSEGAPSMGPLTYGAALLLATGLCAVAVTLSGRALGGQGQVGHGLLLMAWLQVVDMALQAGTTLVAAVAPPLAGVAVLARLGVTLWCLIGFVQALHGFGPGRAVGTVVLGFFGLAVAMVAVLIALDMGGPIDA